MTTSINSVNSVNSGVNSGVNLGVDSVKSGVDSVKSKINSSYFDSHSKLIHDLFFDLLQVSVTLFLFIGIIGLTKYPANDLYPTNLHSTFYGDDESCDLGKLYAGETRFCNEKYNAIHSKPEAGKSFFGTKLQTYVKNMGYLTSDSFSIILLWLSYLALNCEQFSQIILNGIHQIAISLNGLGVIINLIVFVILASSIDYLNNQCIRPFLTKYLNFSTNKNIMMELASDIFIHVAGIFTLLFLFFIIPLSLYYIFSVCRLLLENLSIQMNLLCIFAIYTGMSTLVLLIKTIQTQMSSLKSDSINIFVKFISSYMLFFIVPIIVSIAKLYQLIVSLFSNISFTLDSKYKIVFMAILLFSFYESIKNDLDSAFKFPFSMIYAGVSICTLLFLYKKSLKTNTNANVNATVNAVMNATVNATVNANAKK